VRAIVTYVVIVLPTGVRSRLLGIRLPLLRAFARLPQARRSASSSRTRGWSGNEIITYARFAGVQNNAGGGTGNAR